MKTQTFTTAEQSRIIADYAAGQNMVQLGHKHYCDHGTIRNVLLRNNVAIRPRNTPYDKERSDTIVAMRMSGITYEQIAEKLSITRRAVYMVAWRDKRRVKDASAT